MSKTKQSIITYGLQQWLANTSPMAIYNETRDQAFHEVIKLIDDERDITGLRAKLTERINESGPQSCVS